MNYKWSNSSHIVSWLCLFTSLFHILSLFVLVFKVILYSHNIDPDKIPSFNNIQPQWSPNLTLIMFPDTWQILNLFSFGGNDGRKHGSNKPIRNRIIHSQFNSWAMRARFGLFIICKRNWRRHCLKLHH